MSEKPLSEDFDHTRWAKEFIHLNPNVLDVGIDYETMAVWFANAIMCGFDEAMRRERHKRRGIDAENI